MLLTEDVLTRLERRSLVEEGGLRLLLDLIGDVIQRGVQGDVVECGVYDGGSAAVLGAAPAADPSRRLWLFDSFQGVQDAGPHDGPVAARFERELAATPGALDDSLRLAGIARERVVVRDGWFEDTFRRPLPEHIAFLHIDADFYDSVLLCLRTLYDSVRQGGIVVIDDFGWWEGSRAAFYDFVAERRIQPLVERFGNGPLYWAKGRAHHRDRSAYWRDRGGA